MFLTNDVTLLILVPLTLSMETHIRGDLRKMVFFEALAVNAGSALTPIGNPQNIYIWHVWGASVLQFIIVMLPLTLFLLALLLIFAILVFPNKKMDISIKKKKIPVDSRLAYLSLSLIIILLLAMNLHVQLYLYPVIFIIYAFYGLKIYGRVDWLLLLIFILFFVDFTAIAKMPVVYGTLSAQPMGPLAVFVYSAVFSQFMSNVPAAILVSQFTNNYPLLLYGVSVGGNGTLIASLANLIALRFLRGRKAILEFHKYSIPYFVISFTVVAVLVFLYF